MKKSGIRLACDGVGELATMKEEFRDVLDKVIQYAQERKYISGDVSCDLDSFAEEMVEGRDPS